MFAIFKKETPDVQAVFQEDSFNRVPDELVLEIFSYLNVQELLNVSLVSKRFKALAHDAALPLHRSFPARQLLCRALSSRPRQLGAPKALHNKGTSKAAREYHRHYDDSYRVMTFCFSPSLGIALWSLEGQKENKCHLRMGKIDSIPEKIVFESEAPIRKMQFITEDVFLVMDDKLIRWFFLDSETMTVRTLKKLHFGDVVVCYKQYSAIVDKEKALIKIYNKTKCVFEASYKEEKAISWSFCEIHLWEREGKIYCTAMFTDKISLSLKVQLFSVSENMEILSRVIEHIKEYNHFSSFEDKFCYLDSCSNIKIVDLKDDFEGERCLIESGQWLSSTLDGIHLQDQLIIAYHKYYIFVFNALDGNFLHKINLPIILPYDNISLHNKKRLNTRIYTTYNELLFTVVYNSYTECVRVYNLHNGQVIQTIQLDNSEPFDWQAMVPRRRSECNRLFFYQDQKEAYLICGMNSGRLIVYHATLADIESKQRESFKLLSLARDFNWSEKLKFF